VVQQKESTAQTAAWHAENSQPAPWPVVEQSPHNAAHRPPVKQIDAASAAQTLSHALVQQKESTAQTAAWHAEISQPVPWSVA